MMHLARCVPKLLQKYFGSLNYGPPCLYRVGQEKMIEKIPIFGQYIGQKPWGATGFAQYICQK